MTPTSQPALAARRAPQSVDSGRLILQDLLGVGAYGCVYRAQDSTTGETLAVKCLNTSGLDSRQLAFQRHEAELHGRVSGHPNIATLHRVVAEGEALYMVMDCGLEGDLFFAVTERGGFVGNDLSIKSAFGQIAAALIHCHSMGVYHRDLKPENIIMFGDTVKLVDFGLATSEPVSSEFGCGSTFYLSPECQGGYVEAVKSYDSASNDVWSLGVILINLVFGRNPWKQACPRDETFSAFVANTDFLKTILPMSDELNEIIKSVFCLNPKKRISLSELANRVEACKCFTAPEFRASTRKSSTSNSPLTLSPSKAALADAACNPTPATASGEGTAAAAGRTVGTSGEENGKDQGQDSGIDLLSHP